MVDRREVLPIGTTIELDHDIYKITGEPIGYGGGSILYPAQKQFLHNGVLQTDGIMYVLKECYPAASSCSYTRADNGEIIPVSKNAEDMLFLHQAQLMQCEEETISKNIYQTASRMLPIRRSSQSVVLTLPDQKESAIVPNTVTLMDSLAEKGQSLTAWIKKNRRFNPAEAFRIIQQVLFALQEVHQAGYLHLDIQDGNVFLRGTLDQKNELVTLIDFGCARKLIEGKTAPIWDKVIFTTQGFSAPEILLHNDGNLQLGKEADIYSVGCLLLYLLTGQRVNVRELIANRTGVYLRSNQLRRIQCPKHLVDEMQRILAQALAKEPENRYHSVENMLEEVTALAEALQPKPTSLGAVKYDAFVCYKHGPVDSAAALTLQRALENYHAPKGIAEKRKPFGRVFVDEGELSSCADFGQQIREALRNSEWLIVICSPDTPLSPWVQLEIETFLEYHARSQILAVLTGGNPEISFPPQLKGDANGVGEVFAAHAISSTSQEAEKQLKGDALLKIAAPMLNTTFDTLKQRQKIYLLQRVAAVTAGFLLAAVGFAAYALNRANVIAEQTVRIEQEYENALINESRFLAEQAQKRLDDKDPLGAIELALAALPSETQDRPTLTEAEYVLGKALGIYTTPCSVLDTVTAVGKIETDDAGFFLDDSGNYLFTWDEKLLRKGIQVWDTETLTLVQELCISDNNYVSATPLLTKASALFAWTFNQVSSIDFLSGNKNWSWEQDHIIAVCVSQDKSKLLVFSRDQGYDFGTDPNRDPATLTIDILSADTGEQLHHDSLLIDENQRVEKNICLSPDLKWAAIPAVNTDSYYTLWPYSYVYLVDLETSDCKLLLEGEYSIQTMQFFGNLLAVMRSGGYTLSTLEGKVPVKYITPCKEWLEAYDVAGCDLLWSCKQTLYPTTTGIYAIASTQYDDSETTGEGILYTYDDQCVLLDRETGRVIREYELSDAVMDIAYTPNGFETINADGWYSLVDYDIDYEADTVVNLQYWKDAVTAVCRIGDWFFIQSSSGLNDDCTIRKYQLNKYDESYTSLWTDSASGWYVLACHAVPGGTCILLARDNQLCLIDAEGSTWTCDIPGPTSSLSSYGVVGLSENGTRLYLSLRNFEDDSLWIKSNAYYVFDIPSGKMETLELPREPANYIRTIDCVFSEESLFFTTTEPASNDDGDQTSFEKICVFQWDFRTNTLSELYSFLLDPAEERYGSSSLRLDAENRLLYFAVGTGDYSPMPQKLVCIDLKSTQSSEVSLPFLHGQDAADFSWYQNPYLWSGDGNLAFFQYGDWIYIVEKSGELRCSIPANDDTVAIWLSPDEHSLFLFSADNLITRYRVSSGARTGCVDLTAFSSLSLSRTNADELMWEYIDESTLAIYTKSECFLMDNSSDTLKLKATIDHCIGYDTSSDSFITADMEYIEKEVGSIPRYTLEELIRKGNVVLGNQAQP